MADTPELAFSFLALQIFGQGRQLEECQRACAHLDRPEGTREAG
jgi:hypothetical protein